MPVRVTSSILRSQISSLEMDTEGKKNKETFEERENIQEGGQYVQNIRVTVRRHSKKREKGPDKNEEF